MPFRGHHWVDPPILGVQVAAAGPPVAYDGTLATDSNTPASGTLVATGGVSLTYAVADLSNAHGTVQITNDATGAYTYTPTSGYYGSASFTFYVSEQLSYAASDSLLVAAGSVNDAIFVLGQQSGARVVAGGIFQSAGFRHGFVMRADANLDLDPTFGTAGKTLFNFAGSSGTEMYDVQILSDDSILAMCGAYTTIGSLGRIGLAKFDANGNPDNSFGTGGMVVLPLPVNAADLIIPYGIQPKVGSPGKYLIAARTGDGAGLVTSDWVVVCVDSTGTLDPTWGTGGVVTANPTTYDGSNAFGTPYALQQQTDGKIILAGYAYVNATDTYSAIVRLNSDGSFDTSFSGDGKYVNLQNYDYKTVIVQSTGHIVAVGETQQILDIDRMLLTRWASDGTLVNNTVVHPDDKNIGWYGVAMGDKLLRSGSRRVTGVSSEDIALYKFNADCTPDTTFHAGGILSFDLGGTELGFGALAMSDGSLVVGGGSSQGGVGYLALAKATGVISNIATITITVTATGGLLIRRRRWAA